jgi:hypothetical protein
MSGASPGVTKVGLAGWGGPSSQLRTLGSLATLLSHCERIPRQVDPSRESQKDSASSAVWCFLPLILPVVSSTVRPATARAVFKPSEL